MQALVRIALANAAVAAVAALLVALAARVLRRPALAHVLWLLVLLKLLTPPLLRVPLPMFGASVPSSSRDQPNVLESPRAAGSEGPRVIAWPDSVLAAEIRNPSTIAKPPASLPPPTVSVPARSDSIARQPLTLLGFLWLIGSTACLIVVAVRATRFARLLRLAPPASDELKDRTRRLAQRLGLSGGPAVYLLPGVVCPMLWAGFGRPTLLLPTTLWDRLDEAQRDTVLLHELAHVRRRDHWARWLETLVTSLHWWNPVCWWARHELREAEEQCCDAWVVRSLPGSLRPYANALLAAADFVSVPTPPLACGIGQFAHLKRRLTLLKRGGAAHALGVPGVCMAIVFAALLLPAIPLPGKPMTPRPGTIPTGETAKIAGRLGPEPSTPSAAGVSPVESRRMEGSEENVPAVLENDPVGRLRELDRMEAQVEAMLGELKAIRGQLRAERSARPERASDATSPRR